jgi:hypothetical protein
VVEKHSGYLPPPASPKRHGLHSGHGLVGTDSLAAVTQAARQLSVRPCRAKKTLGASEQAGADAAAERAALAERVKNSASKDLAFVHETGVSIKP